MQCLKDLASCRQTTVLMTIHQPRSNIFTSFDSLLVINHGLVTYHGPTAEVGAYFASIQRPIPVEYNPADFLIDVLFDKDIAPLSPSPSLRLKPALSPSATAIEVTPSPSRSSEELKDADSASHAPPSGGDVELMPTSATMGSPARQAVDRVEAGGDSHPSTKDALQLSASNDPTAVNSSDGANPLAQRFRDSPMALRVIEDVARTLRYTNPSSPSLTHTSPLRPSPSPSYPPLSLPSPPSANTALPRTPRPPPRSPVPPPVGPSRTRTT